MLEEQIYDLHRLIEYPKVKKFESSTSYMKKSTESAIETTTSKISSREPIVICIGIDDEVYQYESGVCDNVALEQGSKIIEPVLVVPVTKSPEVVTKIL